MNSRIKNYVDGLFVKIPRSQKANELREEIMGNLEERYKDYLAEDMTEHQAFSLAISNMGDIDEMLEAVVPDENFMKEARAYQVRNARNMAIAIGLYILGTVFLIAFSVIGEAYFNEDVFATIGVCGLLIICAIATGIIVYTKMSTPIEYKDYDQEEKKISARLDEKEERILKLISSVYWPTIVIIYLAASFFSNQWHITWTIWVFAAIAWEIIKVIFELAEVKS